MQCGSDSDEMTVGQISRKLQKDTRRHKGAKPSDKKKHKILNEIQRPVGAPKKAKPIPAGTQSILKYVTFKGRKEPDA